MLRPAVLTLFIYHHLSFFRVHFPTPKPYINLYLSFALFFRLKILPVRDKRENQNYKRAK